MRFKNKYFLNAERGKRRYRNHQIKQESMKNEIWKKLMKNTDRKICSQGIESAVKWIEKWTRCNEKHNE